ncbi:MFS transporter [Geminicoccaceae bacterium 1502E]|nr:MFS transporter [Geminicoccaceae bacterium 1502E]
MDAVWLRIGWLWVTGVVAAAQLGKMAALMPLIAHELALSLTAGAALVSLLEAGGAVTGRAAGSLVQRLGRRTGLLWGLALLAAGGLGGSLAGSATPLLGWRLIESLGYVLAVIAAPLLIIEEAGPARRSVALALWSSFVPVGLALGAVLAGLAADWLSWRSALLGSGLVALAALVVTARLPARGEKSAAAAGAAGRVTGRAWALATGFGCYTIFEVGLLALLPAFLVEQAGASPGVAGLLTGAASLATVAGSATAAWWGYRGGSPRPLMAAAIILPALLLFLVFREQSPLAPAAAVAILLNAISGVVPGLAFAMLPAAAGSVRDLPAANGLFTQFGAGGSLLGPPLMAVCVAPLGWQGAALLGAVASAFCLLLLMLAGRPHAASSAALENGP